LWERPDTFLPERFREWDQSSFDFIPQGGGDHYSNHRCAGEWLTIDLMKMAAEFLSRSMIYDVPEQDLQVPLTHIPSMPNSRFIMRNVRRVPDPVSAR
jgi:fatty-acid peroxygenase